VALLLRTLPPEARLSRRSGDDSAWDPQTELLAQLVEVMSVSAAGRQLRKPVQVPRPEWMRPAGTKRGFRDVIAAAQVAGRVRVG
jgi:hypothetical protein